MDKLQQIQDDEYTFPYHYVSQFRGEFTQSFYDSWGINYVSTIEFIIDKLKKESSASVVDIGCGDGRLTYELQKSFPDKKVSGFDYSARAIAMAKCMNPTGDYQQIDIIRQPPEKKYEAGVLMEVFEHIKPEEADNFVASIKNIIAPKGILYVTVPHANKPIEYKHYRHFTVQSLTKCFEPHFTAVEIVPFESRKLAKRTIDHLLGNRFFILNSARLRKILYDYYKRNLFVTQEKHAARIFVKFVRND